MQNNIKKGGPLVLLILIVISSLGINGLYNLSVSASLSDTVTLIISKEAIDELGLSSYTVNYATLYIPGVLIKLPDKVTIDKEGNLIIVFDHILNYMKDKNIMTSKNSQPVITVNIADYNSDISKNIIISTESLQILHIIEKLSKSTNNINSLYVIREAINKTREDPLYLLRNNNIYIEKEDINILKIYKYLYGTNMHTNIIKNIISEKLNISINCNIDEPFPYPGTGIYRSVDNDKYNRLSSKVPEWWYDRYVDTGGDTAEDDYRRLVKDVFASVYYVDKSKYADVNDAITTVTSLIDTRLPPPDSGSRVMGTVSIFSIEGFIGSDLWIDTFESTDWDFWLPPELPLFRYKFTSELNNKDGNNLHVDSHFWMAQVTGAVSGFMFAGLPITHTDPVNITQKHIELSADLNSNERRVGTIKVVNYTLTLGEDSVIIRWVVYDNACSGYYVLVPVATITPLYTVEYSINDITGEYSSDGDLLENFNTRSITMEVMEWIEDKEENSPNDDEILFSFNASASTGSISMNYNSLIDIPPLLGPILDMVGGNIGSELVKAALGAYDLLSSINIMNANVSATIAFLSFKFVQQSDLSKDIYVHISYYRTEARSLFDPLSDMNNAVEITVRYNPPPPPPCGPTACPTSTNTTNFP